MNTQAVETKELSVEELNDLILDSIQDIKGKNIIKLDLRKLDDAPTDFFFICEGDSNVQVKAIADNVYGRVKREGGQLPLSYEGHQHSTWVCIDYFNTVVHVFYKEKRSFYQLEDLWSDAIFTEYETL